MNRRWDDGTVRHHLSNLKGTNGQFNDWYLIYRHRGGHCINYVLVFALFMIVLLLACTGTLPSYDRRWGHKILKQAKLGQFSIFSLQNWTKVCLNHSYNGLVSFDCTDLSSDSLKKERLCLKIMLGQAWLKLYIISNYSPCDRSIVVWIELAC